MANQLTWLHLSDIHFSGEKRKWDSKRVTESLIADIGLMERANGLLPDLLFFTGDAAYGNLGSKPGQSLCEQFEEARDFLERVRTASSVAIPKENTFLVPGNHDINRQVATPEQFHWLEHERHQRCSCRTASRRRISLGHLRRQVIRI